MHFSRRWNRTRVHAAPTAHSRRGSDAGFLLFETERQLLNGSKAEPTVALTADATSEAYAFVYYHVQRLNIFHDSSVIYSVFLESSGPRRSVADSDVNSASAASKVGAWHVERSQWTNQTFRTCMVRRHHG